MNRPVLPPPARTSAARALADALLQKAAYLPEPWPARQRERQLASILAHVDRTRRRGERAIAVAACCAAFLAGVWAASSSMPRARGPVAASPSAPGERIGPGAETRLVPEGLAAGIAQAPQWEAIELAGAGRVEVQGPAGYALRELPEERQLHVASGVLRAQITRQDPLRPLVVVSPHLRVVVVGTRFDVFSDAQRTRVEVLQGRVRVESPPRFVELTGGESITSDDPRLASPEPTAAPTAGRPRPPPHRAGEGRAADARRAEPGRGAGSAAAGRAAPGPGNLAECGLARPGGPDKACLQRLAHGDALLAQNALLALGNLARDVEKDQSSAVEHWRSYLERFPEGALAPEAALRIFETLLRQRRVDEAIAAAASFEERFPDDPRSARVRLARARLLCGPAGERVLGRLLLERLRWTAEPALREEAADALARCQGPSTGPSGPRLMPREIVPGD